MTHPLFRKDIFVETAFAKRFQKMLQDAWDNRSWHLLVADPGAGKTMSIRDLQKRPVDDPFSRWWLPKTMTMNRR